MTRNLPAFLRVVALLLCTALLLGSAVAQDPLPLPDAPSVPDQAQPDMSDDPQPEPEYTQPETPDDEHPEPEYLPTAQPLIPSDSLGRVDLSGGEIEVPPIDLQERQTRFDYPLEKVDDTLNAMLMPYIRGYTADADVAARGFYLPQDAKGRYLVTVSAASGVTGKAVAQLVKLLGGKVQFREGVSVYAKLTPEQMTMLANEAVVGFIQPQAATRLSPELPTGIIRDPAGEVYTEGFDVLNAYQWHQAGNLGSANVEVAVIDFGFGTNTSAAPDLSCLASYPSVTLAQGTMSAGDTTRGLDMAEVICDLVPQSRVRLYKANTANALYDAIATADNTAKVIVIGADFGAHFSPGDGTFGRASSKDVYAAIAAAKANGVTVIAAAGNANDAYTAFPFTGDTVTVALKARPGDTVGISWDDWESSPNQAGSAADDIIAHLTGAGFAQINKPARSGGNPSHQFTVPANCTLDGLGYCNNLVLTLVNLTGGSDAASVTVQVSISGGLDRSLSVSGATPLSRFGTLSRPADSRDVIAVGAVCVDYKHNFPIQDYSANGPIYSTGGRLPEPGLDPLTAYDVKPDVVGPANVSVFDKQISGLDGCNEGLRGTQAGAAHIGGMVALLLNGNATSGFKTVNAPANIIHYLRTHSIDLPLDASLLIGPNAAGYDNVYGAGLPVLGRPNYNYDASLNAQIYPEPNLIPSGECSGGFLYVGPRNAGASVISANFTDYPFQSIMQAAYYAALSPVADCVIVLPGEYSTPFVLSGLNNSVGIYGYQGVSLIGGTPPSVLVTQNRYYGQTPLLLSPRDASVYVVGGGDFGGTTLGGFDFRPGSIFDRGTFGDPQVLVVEGAKNFTLTRSRVNNFTSNETLIELFNAADGATISETEFLNNTGQAGAALIGVYDSGSSIARTTINNNRFENNDYDEGDFYLDISFRIDWTSMIRSFNSYVDIVSNTMRSNAAETLLQGVTTDGTSNHEFRILGNVIVDTTLRSQDLFTPGPLVHGFFQRHIMAVNNTIAQTKFAGAGAEYRLLFGRGDLMQGNAYGDTPPCDNMCGTLGASQARWDIHGNLLLNNQSARLAGDTENLWGAGCGSILGGANTGAQFNWVDETGTMGDCVDSMDNPAYGNVQDIDPMNTGVGPQLIKGGTDVTRPEYYSPISNGQPEPNLIGDGPDAFVLSPSTNLSAFIAGTDVRGDIRRNSTIDIGAYEYTPFLLMNPIPRVGIEDNPATNGVIEFDINDPSIIQGGFPPYTGQVEVNGYPQYYGTHCDARFTSPLARGTSVEYINASTLTVAYCPPRNFHTDSALVVGGVVNLTVRITDSAGSSNVTTVQYTITPTNDAPLATSLGDNIPEGDIVTAAIAITTDPAANIFRMRPYVDFSENFFFSEANNIDTSTNGPRRQVDYNFSYSGLTLVPGAPENDNPEGISGPGNINFTVNPVSGIVNVDTRGLLTEASGKFSYTVSDRNGNGPVTNYIVLKAVSPPIPFNQLEPASGFVVNNIDTLTGFRWEVSSNSQTYDLEVRTVVAPAFTVPLFTLTGLTPGVTPGFVCTQSCFLTLTPAQKQLLTVGQYIWTVKADNQGLKAAATNSPLSFTVNTGKELIVNGGFEAAGSKEKFAANWALSNATGDKRLCPGGVNDSCYFQLKAHGTTTAKLVQKLGAIGRQGDTLVLSAATKSTNLKANIGVLQVVVKYVTGDKEKLVLTAPSGTSSDYSIQATSAVALRFPVKSYKVTAMIKPGKGKLQLDNVSLVLDEQAEFRLLSPADNVTTIANPATLTQLQWESSASASNYTVMLLPVGGGSPIINASFTAAGGDDPVTCAEGLCVYSPLPLLTDGEYIWSVSASNGMTASNAPFDLRVNTQTMTELVVNGGFEDNTNKGLPRNWKAQGAGSSSVCASGTTHPEYQGNCAWRFTNASSKKATLKQNLTVSSILVNDRVTLRGAAALQKAAAGAEIKLQIVYTNGGKEVRRIKLLNGSTLWVGHEAEGITITAPVKKATLTLSYKGTGKVFFDNISVIREAGES